MDSANTHGSLPYLDTQTRAFIENPNAELGTGAERIAMARTVFGTELYAYDLARLCFRDRRFGNRSAAYFAERGASPLIMTFIDNGNFNMMAPEQHARVRAVMVKGFTPPRVDAARSQIVAQAEHLADTIAPLGRCNFVSEFAHYFSIGVVSAFIGIPPEDVRTFDRATVELRLLGQVPLQPGIPRLETALSTLHDYGAKLVQRKRSAPGPDFVSDLIAVQRDGGKLSPEELVWSIAGVLLAGHDTTRYQLAACVRVALDHGLWETLAARPDLVPALVNEALRLYPATPRQIKILLEDMTIGGEPFREGEVIAPNMGAAGRDPSVFANPDRADLFRAEPLYDIGFGYGAHYCLGHALAKSELVEGMTVLTRRFTDVAIDGPIAMKTTGVIAGLEDLPLRYRPRA